MIEIQFQRRKQAAQGLGVELLDALAQPGPLLLLAERRKRQEQRISLRIHRRWKPAIGFEGLQVVLGRTMGTLQRAQR